MDQQLQRGRHRPGRALRAIALLAHFLTRPLVKLLRPDAIVTARIWGTPLLVRADHHLPRIVAANPFWSQSLVHALAALDQSPLRIVDVGANIGDTVALLESHRPGVYEYLCIEADDSFFELCVENTKRAYPRIRVTKCFVGDLAGSAVAIEHGVPGTATSRLLESGGAHTVAQRIVPLDQACAEFGASGGIDLLKIDTDGFEFKILRSGQATLRKWKPLVFFEWDPKLWEAQNENSLAVFDFLSGLGYSYFSFFSDNGFHYADVELPGRETLRSLRLASLARTGIDNLYFDVLAGPPEVCRKAVELNVRAMQAMRSECSAWVQVGPAHWR